MNVMIGTGESIWLTKEEAVAMKLMDEQRCNSYLDLVGERIPLDIWHTMQDLLLSGKVFPVINRIIIKDSNISIDDVRPELRSMIVYY
jgi:hypothetical protein